MTRRKRPHLPTAKYHPIRCPKCDSDRKKLYKVRKPYRYCVCLSCGQRYKAVPVFGTNRA
jgi:hypothetical protein